MGYAYFVPLSSTRFHPVFSLIVFRGIVSGFSMIDEKEYSGRNKVLLILRGRKGRANWFKVFPPCLMPSNRDGNKIYRAEQEGVGVEEWSDGMGFSASSQK